LDLIILNFEFVSPACNAMPARNASPARIATQSVAGGRSIAGRDFVLRASDFI
jgi:hypothetical protein